MSSVLRKGIVFAGCLAAGVCWAEKIDRHALVTRHNVTLTKADAQESLQAGNGGFALGVDVTGLQTFYGNTFSDWAGTRFHCLRGRSLRISS